MTSHLVETVRDIPLNEERIPVNVESGGFPFDDRDFDRERTHSSFRSQLDDLAKRHPEFAEHLNIGSSFPFRSHTLGRRRRSSDANTSTENPTGSQDAEFRRYPHDRPHFSRFDRFDFPFPQYFEDFYEPEYQQPPAYQQQYNYSNQPPQSADVQHQETKQAEPKSSQPSSPQPTASSNIEKPPQVPHCGRKQNIQQSNTVDLGQKQEPVDENRGQRSMSAPPENRSTGQRFVSSINIPIQRPSGGGGGDMGAKASAQPSESQHQQQANKPNERVIPIHVEGRDEPVLPKNVNTTFSQPPPQPQPERIFGRNPTHFTQFLNREPHGFVDPEDHYRQQQQQYQKQQQQNFQQQQQQQHQKQPQQPPQPTHPQQVPTEPQPEPQPQTEPQPPPKSTQIEQIQNIQKDVLELMNQVEKFNGKPRDKQYLYLDEMLTRNLIKLDNIETEGKENIRQTRKEAIKCIEKCISILEAKANANLAAETQQDGEQKMETEKLPGEAEKQTEQDTSSQNVPTQQAPEQSESTTTTKEPPIQEEPVTLEVSGVTRTGSVVNATETPMEVTVHESKQEVPAPAVPLSEQQNPVDAKLAIDTQQKTEEEEKVDEIKQDEAPTENMEVTPPTTEGSEVTDKSTVQEDKKEKKKGKKKEKIEKK